jgi:Transcriptional regulator containing an amidase domain and an AraC-type DNA-binding HTH domain
LETDDLDRAREFVSGVWERHTSVMRRGRVYGLRWNEATLTNTTLSFMTTPSRIRVECAPVSDCYRITMHEKGGLSHRINGYETVSTTTQAVVHSPGQELQIDTEPFRTLLLGFDGAFVRQALFDRFGRVPPSDELAREVSLTSLAGVSLRSLCRWMAVELDRPGRGSLGSLVAVGNLEGTLLTLFLNCLTESQEIPKRQLEEVAEARVSRVEDWIDAHLGEAIRVDTLAKVANASVRALENAFRRYRGCTPMEAVTRRRLIHARQALQIGAPGTTVTSAATDSGFFHLGRFAARYRDAFGESPSSTLREPPVRRSRWD